MESIQKSNEQHTSQWNDSILSKRKARLLKIHQNKQKKEEELLLLEQNELQYQTNCKQEKLDSCQKLLLEQNDERIRYFRSQQWNMDIHEKRQIQWKQQLENKIKQKKKKEKNKKEKTEKDAIEEKKLNQRTQQQQQDNDDDDDNEDEENNKEQKECLRLLSEKKKEDWALAQEEQRKHTNSKLEKMNRLREETLREAEQSKELARQNDELERTSYLKKIQSQQKHWELLSKETLKKEQLKQRQIEKEREEAKHRDLYWTELSHRESIRKSIVQERFEQRRPVLSDDTQKRLDNIREKESILLRKQEKDIQDKHNARIQNEAQKRHDMNMELQQKWNEQIQIKKANDERKAQGEAEHANFVVRSVAEQDEKERKKERDLREVNKMFRNFQELQFQEKNQREEKERQLKIVEGQQEAMERQRDKERFKGFALGEIAKYRAEGKETKLLERAFHHELK